MKTYVNTEDNNFTIKIDIIFLVIKVEIKANNYKANEVLRFIRQNTNQTQKDFAKSINKSEDWEYSNECGRSRYYFSDLIDIANKYNLEIIIKEKNAQKNRSS